jgi:hypothetical protein
LRSMGPIRQGCRILKNFIGGVRRTYYARRSFGRA